MTAETETVDEQPVRQPAPVDPWMTVREAAARSRHHYQYVYDALRLYESSRHKQGLRGHRPRGRWRIHVDDVDAWIKGEAPGRRLRTAS
jgi:excisionase family DNA binding protein